MNPKVLVTAGVAATALLVTACAGDDGPDGAGSGSVSVVAAAYPFTFVADRVGGELVSVENLTSPGAEPHDIELTPQQVAEVSEADLLVYEASFQPSVDDAVDSALASGDLPDDAILDVTDVVPLEDTGAEGEHEEGDHEEGGHEEGDHEEGGHEAGGHEAGEDGHEDDEAAHEEDEEGHESELDPHVWLDPVNMVAITRAVADQLAEADPDNTATYRQNAKHLVEQLQALDRAFRDGLADCERTTVVTAHDAFRYLAARYGLEMVPIAGIEPTQEPSPAQQAEISDLVEREGITTIFTEELVSPAVAESIADEAGVSTATLSPIEGLADETSDEDYLSLMRANLRALEEANGCR